MSSDDGNPASSIAGEALLAAQAKEEPGSPEAEARGEDAVATLDQARARCPIAERTFDNPEWVKFLLYDNRGEVRKVLRSFILDDQHVQIITRLPGNASIEDEGESSDATQAAAKDLSFPNATIVSTTAPRSC